MAARKAEGPVKRTSGGKGTNLELKLPMMTTGLRSKLMGMHPKPRILPDASTYREKRDASIAEEIARHQADAERLGTTSMKPHLA